MSGQVSLSPKQAAAVLVIEGALNVLQCATQQLEGFLKFPEAAAVTGAALKSVNEGYQALVRSWQNGIVVVPAGSEKALMVTP